MTPTLAEIGREQAEKGAVNQDLIDLGRDLSRAEPFLSAEDALIDTLHIRGAIDHAQRTIDERHAHALLEGLKGQARIANRNGGEKLVVNRKLTAEERSLITAVKPAISKLLQRPEYRAWFKEVERSNPLQSETPSRRGSSDTGPRGPVWAGVERPGLTPG